MRFHQKKFAEEYESRLSRENYPGTLLNELLKELDDINTVIDIGAGTGFFTVPLAERGFKITAVEPSIEMIKLMESKYDDNIAKNITVSNKIWNDWSGEMHDALISMHSVYPMGDVEKAVDKMIPSAKKKIVLVRDIPSKSISDILRNELNIVRSQTNMDFKIKIESCLNKSNISFSSRKIVQERISSFQDVQTEAEYYRYHFKIDDSYQEKIKDIIIRESYKDGDRYQFKAKYFDMMYIF